MKQDYLPSLRIVFIIHAIIAILVGLQHMILPQLPGDIMGVDLPAPILYRILGAAVFAFGISSWMASRSKSFESVAILILMEVIWSILGAGIIAWGILAGKLPGIEWPNAILLFIFGMIFIFYWMRSN